MKSPVSIPRLVQLKISWLCLALPLVSTRAAVPADPNLVLWYGDKVVDLKIPAHNVKCLGPDFVP